jgi:CheY-like chemotaxis protein
MGRNILIADDSATIQKVISLALNPYDVTLSIASSLAEAIKKSKQYNFDLKIVDANLPGLSRPEDLKPLGLANVLILFGSFENADEKAYEDAGFTQILKKPFSAQDIVSMISSKISLALNRVSADKVETIATVKHIADDGTSWIDEEEDDDDGFGDDDSLANFLQHTEEKGKPAFANEESQPSHGLPNIPPPPPQAFSTASDLTVSLPGGLSDEQILRVIQPYLEEEISNKIQESVVKFCQLNLKDIAREVITQELRRLADEKSRLLVDN